MSDMLGPYPLDSIITGDARVLAEAIPDGSVDLIFTDPPYLQKYLPLYSWLSKSAARILEPGGRCFAYGGSEHLVEEINRLNEHLDYFWLFILLHNGACPRMWQKRLMNGYKPAFVFTNGRPGKMPWMSTVHRVTMDKRFHKWGQGAGFAIKMVEMLTDVDDIVFDPFTGGGTAPAACKILGRRYLAFEIDPETAEIARERVRNTQPPLFIPQPQQLALTIPQCSERP